MKNSERKPKYAMRKLSIGLVSCMLGFALVAQPSKSLAAGGEEGEEPATKVEEDAEAPESSNGLENDNPSDELQLDIADEETPEPVGESEEQNKYIINYNWDYNTDVKYYDVDKEGAPFKAKLELKIVDKEGTEETIEYTDNEGNKKTRIVQRPGAIVYKFTDDIDFKVGEGGKIKINLEDYLEGLNLKSPSLSGIYLRADKDANNYKFITGTMTPTGSKEFTYVIHQNMDTSIKEEKEEDAIILEKDKDNLDVNYKIVEYENDGTNDDGTYKFSENPKDKTIKRRKERGSREMVDVPLAHERKFKDGEEFKLVWEDSDIRGTINRNRDLSLYGPKGKFRKLGILADFIDDTHKKYYTLKIEGDDLEGWKVTLGSKLKKKTEIDNIQEQEYKIIRIEDPNLDFGKEVVDREGEKGKTGDVYETIYLPVEGEEDEVVVPRKLVEKNRRIKEIVNKIIRIGTKKTTPDTPILPDSPDEEIPEDQEDLTPEERDELDKLIQDLLDEINKEEETPDTKPEDTKKPTENEEVKPSENEEETKKPQKEDKKEADKKEAGKNETVAPAKAKKADQKSSKDTSPKTGVTGSASILALLGSSLLASFGLRKKND